MADLSDGIAHEFSELMTAVMGNADLALLDVEDPAACREHLRAVLRAFRPDGPPYAVVQAMQLRLSSLRPELESLVKRPRGVDRALLRDALAALGSGSAA